MGHAAIQRDRNLMQFNTEQCKALHLGSTNSIHQHRLGIILLEKASFTGQTLEVLVGTKLNMGQQCTLAAKAAHVSWAALGGLLPAG